MSELVSQLFRPPRFEPFDEVYPERREPNEEGWLDRAGMAATGGVRRWLRARPGRVRAIVPLVNGFDAQMRALDADGIRQMARELAGRLRREGLRDALVAQTFALVREAAGRTLGMRHFDTQVIGGWVLLNGMIAEMETGQGKTLTATLPACAAALAGRAVHVITVNDYLVERDLQLMKPVYDALGISSAAVTAEMDHAARQRAYACDIVYCTNKTVVFDYLRDRIVLGSRSHALHLKLERLYGEATRARKLLLRGLSFAIVDEADSVLADEARTPLIISAEVRNGEDAALANQAVEIARQLQEGRDFRVLRGERRVEIEEAGYQRALDLSKPFGGAWLLSLRREELITQALTALHLFLRDEQYLVRDGKIQVIDEFTGRVMADRSWGHGLHQMIEVKEGCEITSRKEPLARISYQRFFRRYQHLSGMSGTAKEVAGELGAIYGLAVVAIPPGKPSRRRFHPDRIFRTEAEKWACVVATIERQHAHGVPILVGTRSVAASEHLSGLLAECGLPHQVLNAKQDAAEAEVVARAGEPGRITIATNMAGRGTDIKLAPEARELGGLFVILAERHEAGRIDRQIAGRCARQGDPGQVQAILSLEDALLVPYRGGLAERLMKLLARPGGRFGEWLQGRFIRYVQWRTERNQSKIRKSLLKTDQQMGNILSFSGRPE